MIALLPDRVIRFLCRVRGHRWVSLGGFFVVTCIRCGARPRPLGHDTVRRIVTDAKRFDRDGLDALMRVVQRESTGRPCCGSVGPLHHPACPLHMSRKLWDR